MEGETALHGLTPVQYRGMAPSWLFLSNGKGCFSLKLKIRAAISREYPPPCSASSDGTWNTPVHAVTQLMPVCSGTQPLALSVFANLLIYIIFILKSLNRPIPGCHRALFQYLLPLGRKLAGDPSCVGVRSLLFWNILQDGTKPDVWCPGGGTGHLCRPKDRLWGTRVQERTWAELAMYSNVFSVTCAPHAVGVGCRTCLLGMFDAAEHPSGMMLLSGLLTNQLVRLNNYKGA